MPERFTILTVCTGNLCRSPLAELLLAQRFAGVSSIRVRSAGTRAMAGWSMPEPARRIATGMGVVDVGAHRARQVTAEILREADLVLAMTRDHRRSLVMLDPRVTRRAFTVREFAYLAALTRDEDIIRAGAPPAADQLARLRAAVSAVAQGRSRRHRPEIPADDDVIDPYGMDHAVYSLSALQLAPAVDGVAGLLQRALDLGEGA
ncbi:protein-tyrosine phosphatase [Brevibacterium sanguinis]|uniref:Protein-tyrosine phosphatase n=2 Tax=Brevibacterium TaxID=1696 RepID=A0A366IMV7_9MICO|nr:MULTISPECIES: low molecular weight phosphatase family protein [Brevibacterium]RBP66970.1 protein-tyrosine phosphatase [Brevibacterium sanguinis]RBP73495.1 protein-tyrosine phosphatase [Brevibacterium celere]